MKVRRREAGDADLILDFLASMRHSRPQEWVRRPCAFDKCSARTECTWRFNFSGTRNHYCSAPESETCAHRHRAWMRSMPLYFREPTVESVRFSRDPVTREVCRVWTQGVIEAMKGDDLIAETARVLNGRGSWDAIDSEAERLYPKLDRNERRMRAQTELARWVAAFADAKYREENR